MNLNLWQRIQLLVFGHVKVGMRMRPRWKNPIPLYAFECEKHGLVENIPKGWWGIDSPHIPVGYKGVTACLRCPLCEEEKWKYA